MSKRLFFLVPDVATAKTVVAELEELSISGRHIHVIGNHFTPLEGLHEASFLQKSDFNYGLELGLSVGGAAGLLGGLLAIVFPPAGLALGGAAVLATTLAGAGAGAAVSALVAKDMPNHKLDAFERAIAAGEILLLVDVPKARVDEVSGLIKQHHPEAEIGITKPSSALPDPGTTEKA